MNISRAWFTNHLITFMHPCAAIYCIWEKWLVYQYHIICLTFTSHPHHSMATNNTLFQLHFPGSKDLGRCEVDSVSSWEQIAYIQKRNHKKLPIKLGGKILLSVWAAFPPTAFYFVRYWSITHVYLPGGKKIKIIEIEIWIRQKKRNFSQAQNPF